MLVRHLISVLAYIKEYYNTSNDDLLRHDTKPCRSPFFLSSHLPYAGDHNISLLLHLFLDMANFFSDNVSISSDEMSGISPAITSEPSKVTSRVARELFGHLRESSFTCGGTIKIASPAASSSKSAIRTSRSRSRQHGSINSVTIRWDSPNSTEKLILPSKNGLQTLDLMASAEPASFGYQGRNVIDESYRKALKLDPAKFSTSFCPYVSGIIDTIGQILLPKRSSSKQGILAELYKLNVSSDYADQG